MSPAPPQHQPRLPPLAGCSTHAATHVDGPVPWGGQRCLQRFGFDSQACYRNGALMCTSASTCMCIMLLSGGIDVSGRQPSPRGAAEARRGLETAVRSVMQMASTVHGIVEARLASGGLGKRQRHGGAEEVGRRPPSRMAGVWEVFKCLRVSPERIGIKTEELIVCREGSRSTVLRRSVDPAKGGPSPLLYTPSTCFVTLGMVPDCLRSTDGGPVGCVVTSGGHSVCAMHDGAGSFALFDPLPSSLVVGMTGRELADELAACTNMGGAEAWRQNSGGVGGGEGPYADATVFYLSGQ